MKRTIIPDAIEKQFTPVTMPGSGAAFEACKVMAGRGFGAVLIGERGRLDGIFTERDVLKRIVVPGLDPSTTLLRDVMTPDPVTLLPSSDVADALHMMRRGGFRHLPVVVDGEIVGIVSIRDLYSTVTEQLEQDLIAREQFIFGTSYGV